MFEQLESRLSGALKKIRGLSRLTEANTAEAMRGVRLALLDADVSLPVVKQFIENVKKTALGSDVHKALKPEQQIVRIVYDELVNLLGDETKNLDMAKRGPTVILMAGLQGSGKTTSTAKLALHLSKEGYTPMMVSADVHRPAAREQLAVLGTQLGFAVFDSSGTNDPVKICRSAFESLESEGANVLIVDSAGRLQIDDEMMAELEGIHNEINPAEVLFVADAMTGQQAAEVARSFHERVRLTGVILTKLDGDARGGAALSIKSVTGCPVKFSGTGEKPEQFEVFHPDRMASRILGMGDVLTLIEKAQEASDEKEAEKLSKRLMSGSFDFDDFLKQLKMLKNMGPLDQIMGMMPGLKMPPGAQIDDSELVKLEAIINSMTHNERKSYKIINGSRKNRIAGGSGTRVSDVNRLLKQFVKMKKMMKATGKKSIFNQMSGMGRFG
ncbi:MAG: signal recognition particle protein [bacterium]|nr:MAG: signal recognition particle protein [bacterium]